MSSTRGMAGAQETTATTLEVSITPSLIRSTARVCRSIVHQPDARDDVVVPGAPDLAGTLLSSSQVRGRATTERARARAAAPARALPAAAAQTTALQPRRPDNR
jgi:hypothetical protein